LAAQHFMITIELPSTIAASPDFALSKAAMTRFLNRAREAVGLEGEVHVLLANDATLRRLNRRFRGKDKATDVLSFPAANAGGENGSGVAGDLAISLETAARQAARFGHSLRDEVRVLLLHGTLHLAGFDHEADRGEMAAREAELRRELRLPTSLIARVSAPVVKVGNKQRRNTEILSCAQNDDRKGSARNDNGVGDGGRKGAARGRVRA
jgi:probable rRNA maturation factor